MTLSCDSSSGWFRWRRSSMTVIETLIWCFVNDKIFSRHWMARSSHSLCMFAFRPAGFCKADRFFTKDDIDLPSQRRPARTLFEITIRSFVFRAEPDLLAQLPANNGKLFFRLYTQTILALLAPFPIRYDLGNSYLFDVSSSKFTYRFFIHCWFVCNISAL